MALLGLARLLVTLRGLPPIVDTYLKRAIATSALALDREMKRSIQKGPKTGRVYRRSAIRGRTRRRRDAAGQFITGAPGRVIGFNFHRASAPGEAPATDTGRLVSSISAEFHDQGLRATIGVHEVSQVKYARFLEFGTTRMRPRPYVRPAYALMKDQINQRLRRAVQAGLKRRAVLDAGGP